MKNVSTGTLLLVVFLALIFGGSFFLAGGLPNTSVNNPYVMTPTPHMVEVGTKDASNGRSLQIGTIPTIEPTNTPIPTKAPIVQPTHVVVNPNPPAAPPPVQTSGNLCPEDVQISAELAQSCTCQAPGYIADACPISVVGSVSQCATDRRGHQLVAGVCVFPVDKNGPITGGCYRQCEEKPIIYLYPTKQTKVSVSVDTTGFVYKSIPTYRKNGWENIQAFPDGHMLYENQTYHELFYELSLEPITKPLNGIITSRENLKASLTTISSKLGLIPSEQEEFLSYWMTRLLSLSSPYYRIGVVSETEKKLIDNVIVTPAPDTKIYFLLYFKPLPLPYDGLMTPLLLPITPPTRTGFTAVEWGGIVANEE